MEQPKSVLGPILTDLPMESGQPLVDQVRTLPPPAEPNRGILALLIRMLEAWMASRIEFLKSYVDQRIAESRDKLTKPAESSAPEEPAPIEVKPFLGAVPDVIVVNEPEPIPADPNELTYEENLMVNLMHRAGILPYMSDRHSLKAYITALDGTKNSGPTGDMFVDAVDQIMKLNPRDASDVGLEARGNYSKYKPSDEDVKLAEKTQPMYYHQPQARVVINRAPPDWEMYGRFQKRRAQLHSIRGKTFIKSYEPWQIVPNVNGVGERFDPSGKPAVSAMSELVYESLDKETKANADMITVRRQIMAIMDEEPHRTESDWAALNDEAEKAAVAAKLLSMVTQRMQPFEG